MRHIKVEKCKCGHEHCSYWWLVGIGRFVQGSGFEKDEAELIAELLNGHANNAYALGRILIEHFNRTEEEK